MRHFQFIYPSTLSRKQRYPTLVDLTHYWPMFPWYIKTNNNNNNNDNNNNNNNYVDGQICYHFYRKLAELLPKIWQFCYLGRFATMIGRFATRLGRFATGLGRFATFWLSLADLLPNEINHVSAIVFTNLWCAICWGGKMHTSNLVEILVVSYSQLRLFLFKFITSMFLG